eukprot:121257_1
MTTISKSDIEMLRQSSLLKLGKTTQQSRSRKSYLMKHCDETLTKETVSTYKDSFVISWRHELVFKGASTTAQISSNKQPTDDSHLEEDDSHSEEAKNNDLICDVRVRLSDGRTGVILYKNEDNTLIGIELDIAVDSNDATLCDGGTLFRCDKNRGVFVVRQMIVEIVGPSKCMLEKPIERYTGKLMDLCVGMHVHCLIVGSGVIRVVGNSKMNEEESDAECIVGIELDNWNANARNGYLHGDSLFDCDDGFGFIVSKQNKDTLA